MDYQEFQKKMITSSSTLYVDPTTKICTIMMGIDYSIGDFQKMVYDICAKHNGSNIITHDELQTRLGEILIWIEYFSRIVNLDWLNVVEIGKKYRIDFPPMFDKNADVRLQFSSISFATTFATLVKFYSESGYTLTEKSESSNSQLTILGEILGVWIDTCGLIKIEPEDIMDFIVNLKRIQ